MTLRLDRNSAHLAAGQRRQQVVRRASVWEPQAERSRVVGRGNGCSHAGGVRTLSVISRTGAPPASSAKVARYSAQAQVPSESHDSNKGSYLLGSIFGFALMISIVLGGFTASEDPGLGAGAPHVTGVSSQR